MFKKGDKLFGKYEIDCAKPVGSGNFGEVYRANDLFCKRTVAIKALDKNIYEWGEEYLLSELQSMGTVCGHPNVVSIYTVEPHRLNDEAIELTDESPLDDYFAYIVMEWVGDGSLDKKLKDGNLPIELALNICLDMCTGLAYAHEQGLIHRDIKPENILLTKDDIAKVSDFGIAKLLDEKSYASTFCGTTKYMAPEQSDGRYNEQVDIYAAGLVLAETMGKFPFDGETQKEIKNQKKTEPPSIPDDTPEELASIIKKSLRVDYHERYQTATEMAEELRLAKIALYEKEIAGLSKADIEQAKIRWKLSEADVLDIALKKTEKNVQAIEVRLGEHEQENAKLKKSLGEANSAVSTQKQELQNLKNALNLANTERSNLKQERQELDVQLTQEQEKNAEIESRFQNSQITLSSQEQEIQQLKSELQDAGEKLESKTAENHRLSEDLEEQREAKANLETVIENYIRENKKLNSRQHEAEEEKNTLTQSLEEREQENAELSESLKKQREENNRLTKTLKTTESDRKKWKRKVKNFRPALWAHRVAIAFFVLATIGLLVVDVDKLREHRVVFAIIAMSALGLIMLMLSRLKTRLPEMNSKFPEKIGQDGAVMKLIPAGEFQMGRNDGESSEKPVHTVYLDSFYIDKYEVTNALYAEFLNAVNKNKSDEGKKYAGWNRSGCLIEYSNGKYRAKSGYENHPIITVTWYDARDYAKWAGKRLPTEAEWEKAARGGLVGKKYPWGNRWPKGRASYCVNWFFMKPTLTLKPVGSYQPNGYGLYDMAGNVCEWCADWYGEDYYSQSPRQNPEGPDSGSGCVLRGGSWLNDSGFLRCARRYYNEPSDTSLVIGFRCSQDVTL